MRTYYSYQNSSKNDIMAVRVANAFLPFVKLRIADKHSIFSITNDSYPLPKVIFIFYPNKQVKLQIYLQHIYSQFFLCRHHHCRISLHCYFYIYCAIHVFQL